MYLTPPHLHAATASEWTAIKTRVGQTDRWELCRHDKTHMKFTGRFTIQGMLAVMLLFAVAAWWLGEWRAQYLREYSLSQELESHGCSVEWGEDNTWSALAVKPFGWSHRVHGVTIAGPRAVSRDLRIAASFSELRRLEVDHASHISSSEFCELRFKSTKLADVLLAGPQIDDQALEPLKRITTVRSFALLDTAVTDDGVAQLPFLDKVEDLWLCSYDIGSKSIAALGTNTVIWQLDLVGSSVGDSDVDAICAMRSLGSVDLRNTAMTVEGQDTIRRRLPRAVVLGD